VAPTGEKKAAAPAPRPKRARAEQNREKILQAAYSVLAQMGVDAQMTDIAEAAEVGVATLYRNFATKEDLINALLLQYFDRAIEVAEEAVTDPDSWQALVRFFQWVTTLQLENRAVSEFLAGRIGGTKELAKHRKRFYEILTEVTERAQKEGELRQDVNVSDLRTILLAMARLSSGESPLAPRLIRRFGALMLDGLRSPGGSALDGPPLSIEEFDRALFPRTQARAFRRGRRAWPTGH
jgi:AcrR family transcriptional regulator